ncbi:hypothetical protein C8Q75DRAFT_158786 [Abortiporus biennis]|nr:hypothetical protein C8Q75DRAFT_158786 [Abortiporus biennis]
MGDTPAPDMLLPPLYRRMEDRQLELIEGFRYTSSVFQAWAIGIGLVSRILPRLCEMHQSSSESDRALCCKYGQDRAILSFAIIIFVLASAIRLFTRQFPSTGDPTDPLEYHLLLYQEQLSGMRSCGFYGLIHILPFTLIPPLVLLWRTFACCSDDKLNLITIALAAGGYYTLGILAAMFPRYGILKFASTYESEALRAGYDWLVYGRNCPMDRASKPDDVRQRLIVGMLSTADQVPLSVRDTFFCTTSQPWFSELDIGERVLCLEQILYQRYPRTYPGSLSSAIGELYVSSELSTAIFDILVDGLNKPEASSDCKDTPANIEALRTIAILLIKLEQVLDPVDTQIRLTTAVIKHVPCHSTYYGDNERRLSHLVLLCLSLRKKHVALDNLPDSALEHLIAQATSILENRPSIPYDFIADLIAIPTISITLVVFSLAMDHHHSKYMDDNLRTFFQSAATKINVATSNVCAVQECLALIHRLQLKHESDIADALSQKLTTGNPSEKFDPPPPTSPTPFV